jgi:CO/xanthine dehydrogenase FAD-binding subunit
MSSSRHITIDFDYHCPSSLKEALMLLAGDPGSRPLGGGTDLLIQIKTGEHRPTSIVQVLEVKEMSSIEEQNENIRIGGSVQLHRLEESEIVESNFTALHEAVENLGSTQVRNMATLAGNLCNASPSADTATPLIVLGARAEIVFLDGENGIGTRFVPMDEFFTGPGTTVLEHGELLAAVVIPLPTVSAAASAGVSAGAAAEVQTGSCFRKIGRVTLDMAKISCSSYVEREGKTVMSVRVAVGGAAPKPVRATRVEEALTGRPLDLPLLAEAARGVQESISPISDIRSTVAYRRETAEVLVRDTFLAAWERSGGEVPA